MTPLPLPLQCEHPDLIALSPFIGNDIVAVIVTQCERCLTVENMEYDNPTHCSNIGKYLLFSRCTENLIYSA